MCERSLRVRGRRVVVKQSDSGKLLRTSMNNDNSRGSCSRTKVTPGGRRLECPVVTYSDPLATVTWRELNKACLNPVCLRTEVKRAVGELHIVQVPLLQ